MITINEMWSKVYTINGTLVAVFAERSDAELFIRATRRPYDYYVE